ncbi:MAG: 2-C-methyl-D-erythritol 4-phosphate cytidylyltransferase, partial [Duncaniella sp.]|nr:2-C-methyl-D-erythritol 4-phosphate cytidylyltransferase [Duncaniella sp.]
VTDSLRETSGDGTSRAVDRNRFRAVQTPQSFPAGLLREAYRMAVGEGFTDDASVMEAAGFDRLVLMDGDPRNIKVPHRGDLEIAALYLEK